MDNFVNWVSFHEQYILPPSQRYSNRRLIGGGELLLCPEANCNFSLYVNECRKCTFFLPIFEQTWDLQILTKIHVCPFLFLFEFNLHFCNQLLLIYFKQKLIFHELLFFFFSTYSWGVTAIRRNSSKGVGEGIIWLKKWIIESETKQFFFSFFSQLFTWIFIQFFICSFTFLFVFFFSLKY